MGRTRLGDRRSSSSEELMSFRFCKERYAGAEEECKAHDNNHLQGIALRDRKQERHRGYEQAYGE